MFVFLLAPHAGPGRLMYVIHEFATSVLVTYFLAAIMEKESKRRSKDLRCLVKPFTRLNRYILLALLAVCNFMKNVIYVK